MEITEEEEEEQRGKKRQSVVQEERPTTSGTDKSKAATPSTEPPVTLDPPQLDADHQTGAAQLCHLFNLR